MPKMPDTIIRLIRPNTSNGLVPYEIVQQKFYENSYGPEKTKKWINFFLDNGVLESEIIEKRVFLRCKWWKYWGIE